MSVVDDATEARCAYCDGWICLGAMEHEIINGDPVHAECAGRLQLEEAPEAPRRVLDPRAYDTLRAMAEKHGGIGYGLLYENVYRKDSPLSAWALLESGLGGDKDAVWEALHLLTNAKLAGSNEEIAVRTIIKRKGTPNGPHDPHPRVTFGEWCEELGVVRGETKKPVTG